MSRGLFESTRFNRSQVEIELAQHSNAVIHIARFVAFDEPIRAARIPRYQRRADAELPLFEDDDDDE